MSRKENNEVLPAAANWSGPNMKLGTIRLFFRGLGLIAPPLAGKLAYNLWFTPRRDRKKQGNRSFLATADQDLAVQVLGRRIRAWSWGTGPTVLLVHGWEGRASQFEPISRALIQQGFRVVLFDLPAHGESEGKQTDAEEIRQVILALEQITGPFHSVVTHSFGAVPVSYAMDRGLRPGHVVMINPPTGLRGILRTFQKQLGLTDRSLEDMMARTERRLPHLGRDIWLAIDTETNASRFRCPGMVIHDLEDRRVPVAHGKKIAQAWPGAELILTSGLGHSGILKDPSVIEKTVSGILNLSQHRI